jgi:isoquinoline 1-oxidoreductase beta subunit
MLLLNFDDTKSVVNHFKDNQPDPVELNTWVLVSDNNTITIRIAQMEMGQGTITAMAQMLAEEMDADWSKVKAEFISIRRHVQKNRIYGRTETYASWGVSSSHDRLRIAGAQIRNMLISAAARRLKVDRRDLYALNSHVIHAQSGKKISYGELAGDASRLGIPPAATVELKKSDKYRLIGKSIPRLEVPPTTDGQAIYGTDFNINGMKYAAVMFAPAFSGSIRVHAGGRPPAADAICKVIHLQQAIAIVAESWWSADRALRSLKIEFGTTTASLDDDGEIKSRMLKSLDTAEGEILRKGGDVGAAGKAAANILEATYHTPYLEHAAMEPMSCTALVTDEAFEIWVGTQVPEDALEAAAKAAELSPSNGEVHILRMGGSFGRRLQTDFIAQAVEIARQLKGTPIKLIWSREATLRHGFYRPSHLSQLRGYLDRDGNIAALTHRIVVTAREKSRSILGAHTFLYSIPNVLVDSVAVDTQVPDGDMRGVAYTATSFSIQSFMDECARASGVDPYLYQRQHLNAATTPDTLPANPDQNPDMPKASPRERATRLRAVLDEVVRRADWSRPLGKLRGRGLAVHEESDAYYALVAEVTLDGKRWFSIDRVVIAVDPGRLLNPNNAASQIEGSVAFGLTAALYGKITIEDGAVVESNFDNYPLLRANEMPPVQIHWVLSEHHGWGGVAEAVTSAIVPALTNAIYDAGGPRIRSLPIKNHRIVPRGGSAP